MVAFLDRTNGPVFLTGKVPDESRFVSFQLTDDRNVNYQNVVFPQGRYMLYYGNEPRVIQGIPIEVPSVLSVVIVRVEVMDSKDPRAVAAAENIFKTITVQGRLSETFPELTVCNDFSEAVAEEGNRRLDEAFSTTPFGLTVVGPGEDPGADVPIQNHSAGTKGGWGGAGTMHSAYETINSDENGEPLMGSNGTHFSDD